MSRGVFTVLQYLNTDEDATLTGMSQISKVVGKRGSTLSDVMAVSAMYMVSVYKPHVPVVYEYVKTGAEGSSGALSDTTNGTLSFPLTNCTGDFLSDQVVHIVFDMLGSPSASQYSAPRYRWTSLPGVRLLSEVILSVERVDIDTYYPEDVLFQRQFDTGTDKLTGLDSIYGQETVYDATYYAPDTQVTNWYRFSNGAQTLQAYQPPLELWIPLKFWYNVDVASSLQNVMFKTLDRYITCTLDTTSNMIQMAAPDGTPVTGGVAGMNVRIITAELYTRNIYVGSLIQDLMVNKSNIQMIRVHRQQNSPTTRNADNVLLSQIKYPIETLSFGFRPKANLSLMDSWYQFGNIVPTQFSIPVFINGGSVPQLVSRTAIANTVTPVANQIGLSVYGNSVYPMLPESFYSKYLPFITPYATAFGNVGTYMINFSNKRIGYSLTGYLNNSTARELYLQYQTGISGSIPETTLYISARAINFLIYTAGTVSLKYAT